MPHRVFGYLKNGWQCAVDKIAGLCFFSGFFAAISPVDLVDIVFKVVMGVIGAIGGIYLIYVHKTKLDILKNIREDQKSGKNIVEELELLKEEKKKHAKGVLKTRKVDFENYDLPEWRSGSATDS